MSLRTRNVKRTGLIEPPRSEDLVSTQRFQITIADKEFILTIFETHDSFTLYLGSKRIYCVDAQIVKSNTGLEEEGNLTKVRYDIECSANSRKPFIEGSDTILITKIMLTYIKNTFPDVHWMEFTDLSTKKCSNGSAVELSGMKFFTDGKIRYHPVPSEQDGMPSTDEENFACGWYEDHFKASIHPDSKEAYEQMSKYADEKKRTTSWEEFYSKFLTGVPLPMTPEKMEPLYTSSNTFQEFFFAVRNEIKVAKFCNWLSIHNWFSTNFLKFVRFNPLRLTFRMDVSLFNEEYKITPMIGGKRKTRKLKK